MRWDMAMKFLTKRVALIVEYKAYGGSAV